MSIGERIKERRKALKMSVDELARRLGKNRATIYRYENGEIENLPLDVLEPIAKALNTTPAFLMGWQEEQQKNSALADIVLRARQDNEFMSVLEIMYDLDPDKIAGVKQMLAAFAK